jgi:hypothetical protein
VGGKTRLVPVHVRKTQAIHVATKRLAVCYGMMQRRRTWFYGFNRVSSADSYGVSQNGSLVSTIHCMEKAIRSAGRADRRQPFRKRGWRQKETREYLCTAWTANVPVRVSLPPQPLDDRQPASHSKVNPRVSTGFSTRQPRLAYESVALLLVLTQLQSCARRLREGFNKVPE